MNCKSMLHHQQTIASGYLPLRITVFADKCAAGTRALVCLAKGPPRQDELHAMWAMEMDAEACCWTWLEGNRLQVRCYHAGIPIEFCGHGLLASAYAWRHCHWTAGAVQSATQSYRVSDSADGSLWLHCPRIATQPAEEPIPPTWFDHPPCASALAGPDNGYWILRWPDGFDIATLQPDLAQISRCTRRAIIATASNPLSDGAYRVNLRYFAPQYGNPEDSVTGSACVVLADYWRQPQLVLHQRSPRGGTIEAQLNGDSVAIGGQLAMETIPWRHSS